MDGAAKRLPARIKCAARAKTAGALIFYLHLGPDRLCAGLQAEKRFAAAAGGRGRRLRRGRVGGLVLPSGFPHQPGLGPAAARAGHMGKGL